MYKRQVCVCVFLPFVVDSKDRYRPYSTNSGNSLFVSYRPINIVLSRLERYIDEPVIRYECLYAVSYTHLDVYKRQVYVLLPAARMQL